MAENPQLGLLTLAGVAHRCSQETERFFQRQSHDPRYCFELFRRAFVGRDQRAWALVYSQYQPLVAGWVERHAAFSATGEEAQYFVNRAFEKMWNAVPPDRFAGFADLASLLRYLQVCVNSVLLDWVRRAELDSISLEDELLGKVYVAGGRGEGHNPLAGLHRQELWTALAERLNDDRERRVIYGSFVLGLKPRELHRHFEGTFRDVLEIYRIKENVMARLRRDAEFCEIFGGGA